MDVLNFPGWLTQLCDHIQRVGLDSVTLDELAEQVNLTPRALQYAFKQHLNITPMRWVRQQRLKQARHALKTNPSKEVTVTRAALACGFTNLGVFARYYRVEFGENPSVTLSGQ
ncbi:hypothetical protein ICHIJ1_14340 [Fluviibacter phosphoraccumulans]|uniref:helix-turn-helix domain-containing protein n=1 Tax=Fluviibacter phosphoraccumulans TaxID=1751046 RepID=UPI001366D0FE|nr:helix-turn-helix domain-containing protein [Fluviibacter phosphoraccumulans]BBU71515.1 hypothetical protein ICHIJ1_14340 [Fluviibacter phosphoraccumulans]